MLFYVLACIAIAIALLLTPAFQQRHPPVHPHRTCCGWRCRRRADVMEDCWPYRTWCARCHVKRLRRKGELL